MKKYDWFKIDVDKRITELKSMPQTEEVQIALDACEDLIFYVDNPIELGISGQYNIANVFYQEYLRFKKADFLWDALLDFYYNSKKIHKLTPSKTLKLDEDELFTLIHDLFKNATTKTIYNDFLKLYKQRKDNFAFVTDAPRDFYADSSFIPYFNDFFIQIVPNRSFDDIACTAHEYGHGIHLLNNYHPNLFNENNIFMEIISVFFDFLAFDYYSKDSTLKKAALSKYKRFYNTKLDYLTNIVSFITFLKYLKLDDQPKDEAIKIIQNQMSAEELLAFEFTSKERRISEDIPYVLGSAISIELLNIYHTDPEKAFYLLKQIINIDPKLPPQQYFKKIIELGIIIGQSSKTFEDNLKRELKLF